MTRRAVALFCALGLTVAACGDDAGGGATAATTTAEADSTTTSAVEPVPTTSIDPGPSEPAAVAIERVTRTLVDESRVTPATEETPELPSRTLEVLIDAPKVDEPRPLVVFSHGLAGHPRNLSFLRTHLAEAGFVVAAPVFPLTNVDVPGAWNHASDVGEQVHDVGFVIDALLADPEIGPRIDPERLGAIGHSLGGATTSGVALAAAGDPRIDAAVVISAGFGEARAGVPVMVIHGDIDPLVPYEVGRRSYGVLRDRRMLVTLVGGGHVEGILDDDTDLGVALRGLAAAFFARELDGAGPSGDLDGLPLGVVMIEAASATGPFDDWRDYFMS